MATFLEYIKSLAPTFRRADVVESIIPVRESLKSHTLPAYIQAERTFAAVKPASALFKANQKEFELATGARASSQDNLVTLIKKNLEDSLVFLDALEEQAKAILSPTEANLGITYQKATLLRLVDAAFFFNNYAGSLLNRLVIEESKLIDKNFDPESELKRPEIVYLDKYWKDFCAIAAILRKDSKRLGDALQKLPESSVTSLSEQTLPSTFGLAKLDPFGLNRLSVETSLLFKAAMHIANRQANNYKAKQAELELLQLRLYTLQRAAEGKVDLESEGKITRTQSRISALHADLAKDGVRYGL